MAGESCTSFSSSTSPSALYYDPDNRYHWYPSSASAALGSSSPPNVSRIPDLPENIPAKGRGRRPRYLSVVRPVEGSLDLGGIATSSWVAPGGTSQVLVNGGSTDKGLFLLVGETYSRRLAPGTTWVALPTINPVRASSDPMLRNAQGRILIIRRLGDDVNI